jgi:hypothetical protein
MARIAPAARLGQRDGRLPDRAPRRQLGAKHVQKTKERRADTVDAALGHLDDRPLAVAARLLGVERVPPSRPFGHGPQPDLPGRPPTARGREPTFPTVQPGRRLIYRQ